MLGVLHGYRIIESQKGLGRKDLRDHLVPIAQAGTPCPRPGCSKPHPICLICDSGTSRDHPCLSKCSWHLVPLSYQTSPLQYFHQQFPEGKSFPLYIFIALYKGVISHKVPSLSMRSMSHCVRSVGNAALLAPSYGSARSLEWNRRVWALLASAFPGISAGFCMMLISPLLGRSSTHSTGAGNKWKRLCRLNWDKWSDVKIFPPKHREDLICKLYFHFLQGRPRSVPRKRDAFISMQEFNWEKEPRKPKDIPYVIVRNLERCPENEREKMQRKEWYLSLN